MGEGFITTPGAVFDVLDWGRVTGEFEGIRLPVLSDGLTWDVSDLLMTGQVAVIPEPGACVLIGLIFLPGFSRRPRLVGGRFTIRCSMALRDAELAAVAPDETFIGGEVL